MEMNEQILIGADPEIFLGQKGGAIISGHVIPLGDKWNPTPTEVGAVQNDGMALEFNIAPAANLKEFLFNINRTMKNLEEKIKAHSPDFEFRIVPVAKFNKDYMDGLPGDVKALGCTPDFNAYTGKENPSPGETEEAKFMRTASGHIHIGWTQGEDTSPDNESHFFDCTEVVKQMDAILYRLSTLWDHDTERRKLYGAPGAFRPKSYGVEYRVLSNVWLRDKRMQAWVYQATIRAMELLAEGKRLFLDNKTAIYSPTYVHRYLALEYGFPVLPNHKVPTTY